MECPYLIGKNIYLRSLNPDDLKRGYLKWVNDPAVNKYLMVGVKPTSFAELKDYYDKIIQSKSDIIFAIVVKKNKKYIGNIKLGGIDWINRSVHCGRMIGDKKYWNRGYGTEALSLVIEYAFDTLNLNRLYNIIVADNIKAIKSCEKLGMRREGIFSQLRFINGEYKDAVQLAITRDRYEQLKRRKDHKKAV